MRRGPRSESRRGGVSRRAASPRQSTRPYCEKCFEGQHVVKPDLAMAALSRPRRRLVELMQNLNFGRIEVLVIRNGNPILDPLPRVVREVKFGGDNGPRPERDA